MKIINSLLKLKNSGSAETTLKCTSDRLKPLAKHVDLDDPETVKEFIANKKAEKNYKHGLAKAYNHYVKLNGLFWIKPRYRWKKGLPRPPTTEGVNKLIAGSSRKYAVIFKLMAETGISPAEVEMLRLKDLDFERKLVYVTGRKGHLDRAVLIKSTLVALLKTVPNIRAFLRESAR